jgi:glycosyltransferase involved in cell wall biosynthesis
MPSDLPNVSVVVPCRNERDYIESFLGSLARQKVDGLRVEFLIADGMSEDGTRAILEKAVRCDARFRLIDNPGRIVSTGLNAAIRAARGEIIVRMDVHTEYATDYLEQCVAVLESAGADNVGGAWRGRGRSYLQTAIALAFQSWFSCGGAASHNLDWDGPVDSVYLGCWRKATLLRVGLFDEELVRNQDDELNLRLVRGGGKVWQSSAIRSWYYPRASWRALFSQYAQYGYWKVRVIQKHKVPASLRHLVPGAFVAALLALAVHAPFILWARWALLGLGGVYLAANLTACIGVCFRAQSFIYLPVMPAVFLGYHLGYGYGFLRGMIDFWLRRKTGHSAFSQLTRTQST